MAHMGDGPGGTHVHHEGTVTSVDISGRDDVHQLKGSAVGLVGVLFLCVTGSAPLAVVMFNMPYVMPLGSEWGGPGAFFLATIVLTIFSVAMVEMCKKVRAAGGMYTFVSLGLGRELGFMSGFSLLVAYVLFGASLIGGFAAFTQVKLDQYDISIPWIYIALAAVLLCVLLAFFEVEISAKVLGIALMGELTVILVFSFGVLLQGGSDGLSVEPILPWNGLQGAAPGIGIFFAFWSWVGFEAAPNYAEESRDPVRVIPIALYFSCVAVGVLYVIASWAVLSAYGPKNQITDAFNAGAAGTPTNLNGHEAIVDATNLTTFPASALVGQIVADGMSYLIITGSLACAAALGNAGLRYFYAMGREGLLPRALGRTHPVHKSPYVAVFVQYTIVAVLMLAFWFTNHLPLEAYGWLAVQGVIWIMLVQGLTAVSTFFYFRRHHRDEMNPIKHVIAPWLGCLAQFAVVLLLYHNLYFLAAGASYVDPVFELFSGWATLEFSPIGIIGVLLPAAAVGYAFFVKKTDRAKYETMGRFVNEGV
jgi:amino acid transporter